jgi:NAD(P)-dependent dehydrogenase (short-subunit alcohol dehydrogenase family)
MLAKEGCHLHLAARNAADLAAARDKIIATNNVEVTCHAADLSENANAVKLAKECGEVDFLINNAGAIPQGTIDALDDATWKRAWDLKVFGFIDITREIYAQMRKRKSGVIVNVIGAAGERPVASYIAGSMGNAALMAFSRALGAESPEFGVRVVGVNPGGTATDRAVKRLRERAEKEFGNPDRWQEFVSKSPFGRMATIEELGAVVTFLCSPLSGYTTGTIITVDGGASSRRA